MRVGLIFCMARSEFSTIPNPHRVPSVVLSLDPGCVLIFLGGKQLQLLCKKCSRNLECNSVIDSLFYLHKTLSLIPSTANQNNRREKLYQTVRELSEEASFLGTPSRSLVQRCDFENSTVHHSTPHTEASS